MAQKDQVHFPSGIAIDQSNNLIYVTETGAIHHVSIFTYEGQFVRSFGQYEADEGQFESPLGITLDKQGVLYVCDHINNRLVILFLLSVKRVWQCI